ncbi:hypothetical protein AA100600_0779 [Gluconobacter thailandicus F149-1 = NBRC 100600]|nr:hypothetical protein AA100600_0779 [Gluconobacter thailandicus F149-1 = NBRC 100600]
MGEQLAEGVFANGCMGEGWSNGDALAALTDKLTKFGIVRHVIDQSFKAANFGQGLTCQGHGGTKAILTAQQA